MSTDQRVPTHTQDENKTCDHTFCCTFHASSIQWEKNIQTTLSRVQLSQKGLDEYEKSGTSPQVHGEQRS